jgi:hypothetical protein
MIAALAALESKGRDEATQIKPENLIIIDVDADNAGRKKDEVAAAQQLMLLQVNEALLRDQQANAAQKELENVLRAAALAQREQKKSTVIVVVTTIEVNIELQDNDKNEKKKLGAEVFKQEAIVANRGRQETQTVMGKDFTVTWLTLTDCMTSL